MTDDYTVKATPSGENTYLEKTELEFVNDWSELERAVEVLAGHDLYTDDYGPAMATVVEYVPRLLTQYASLLETSYALTEGWEAYVKVHPPTGLYLPGNG